MSDSNRADRGTADEKRSEFERLRPYLLRVAYSHLGTLSEAEDVVQSVQTQNTRGYAGERRETSRGARPMTCRCSRLR